METAAQAMDAIERNLEQAAYKALARDVILDRLREQIAQLEAEVYYREGRIWVEDAEQHAKSLTAERNRPIVVKETRRDDVGACHATQRAGVPYAGPSP